MFLQYVKSTIREFTPPSLSCNHPLPHFRNSFNRYHFPFTYMCTYYLHYIHPSMSFANLIPPLPLTLPLLKQDLFCPPGPQFCKWKKDISAPGFQKLFNLMKSYLSSLVLISWANYVLLRQSLTMSGSSSIMLIFPIVVSMFLDLY
jgi:hypothetical protein